MSRTALGTFTMVLLLIGAGAGATLCQAQQQCLVGVQYPYTLPCSDQFGCGGQKGVNWLSLYPRSTRLTAEDLCNIVGSSAVWVGQKSSGEVLNYFCPTAPAPATPGACVDELGNLATPQASCPSACFCVDCFEGVAIRVKDNQTLAVNFGGSPSACTGIVLGPPGSGTVGDWLVSMPGNFATYQDYANYIGLTSTGLVGRGTITYQDPISGSQIVATAGTGSAAVPLPDNSRAYRLRNPSGSVTYNNPGVGLLPPACVTTPTNHYCVLGTGNGTNYSWWIDLGANQDPTLPTPGDPYLSNVTPASSGSNSVDLAANLVGSINSSGFAGTSAVLDSTGSNCFTINTGSTTFNLWVATGNVVPGSGNWCAVTDHGCTYNPTISLVTGSKTIVPALGTVGCAVLVLMFLVTTTILIRRRLRNTAPRMTADL